MSLHSDVKLEEVIVAFLSKSDPHFYGIRWFDTTFSTTPTCRPYFGIHHKIFTYHIFLKLSSHFCLRLPACQIMHSVQVILLHIPSLFLCAGCPPTSSVFFDRIAPLSYLQYIPVPCYFLPFSSNGTPQ